jgi:zinc D-Ala-D-Ala carboxypeptidase
MTPLTEHFTKEELTHSQTAARLGIDNTPPAAVFQNLVRLCDEILEPLRNAISRPLIVSSGYRCPALNLAVKGSKNSDHLRGLAADVTAPGMDLDELADKVRTLAPYIPLKQCIKEFGQWVHVSCTPSADVYEVDFNPQFLIASRNDKGETVYTRWQS